MPALVEQIQQQILSRRLLTPRQKVLVAVSGGVDSMVLLHSLLALAGEFRWKIFVAHFNHHLRGASSGADARLVRQYAEQHQLPFIHGEARVKDFAREHSVSVEMAARQLRHDFLAASAREQGLERVALAHHADDQVELFFLRLLRGTGGEGIAGMKWQSPSPSDPGVTLIRPLLNLKKSELVEYAREQKIPYREDATNCSVDIRRNRIRHQLLPHLREEYQSELDEVILRFMEIAGAEAELVGEMARVWLKNARKDGFSQLPVAVQRRVIQSQLNQKQLNAGFEQIEWLRQNPGINLNLPGNQHVCLTRDGRLIRAIVTSPSFKNDQTQIQLGRATGEKLFSGKQFIWKCLRASPAVSLKKRENAEYFDLEALGGGVVLRHWRAGDRFQPLGFKQPVKVQDLFVNAKIPQPERHQKVIAVRADGVIVWVEGLRLGERVKVTGQTRRILDWHWREIELK